MRAILHPIRFTVGHGSGIGSSIDDMKAMKNLLKLLVIILLLEESFAQGKCLVYVKDRA